MMLMMRCLMKHLMTLSLQTLSITSLSSIIPSTFVAWIVCRVTDVCACLGGTVGSVAVCAAWLRWSASLGSRPRLVESLCQVIAAYTLRLNSRAGTEGSTVSSLICDRWLILGSETLSQFSPSVWPHNPATGFWPPSATVVSAEPFSHGTGTLQCLQKEMATIRHWSVSLWRDPDDVLHCRILSPWQNWMAAYLGYTLQIADEDAVLWLTSYGWWYAYEKKKY